MIIYFYRATVCHCPSCVFWYFPRKRVAVSYDAATLFLEPKTVPFGSMTKNSIPEDAIHSEFFQ